MAQHIRKKRPAAHFSLNYNVTHWSRSAEFWATIRSRPLNETRLGLTRFRQEVTQYLPERIRDRAYRKVLEKLATHLWED